MSMILHHYPLSPYSEKIRAMSAYAELEWSSCLTSEAPPRGKLDLLSGGYGRIPIVQWGSDIYCDSNLIADEISRLTKKPALANLKLKKESLSQRQWLESKLFFACINRSFSFALLCRIAKDKGVINLLKFLKDRIAMGAKASISTGSPKSAPRYIKQGIADIENILGDNDYMGGTEPNILDFSAYHSFWFLQVVGEKNDLQKYSIAYAWFTRMLKFRAAPNKEIGIEEALSIAKSSKPKKLIKKYLNDHRIGSQIVITPNDYRQIPVTGVLVGADDQRWIIRRESEATGELHLHFPTHAVDVTIRMGG
jgi:glutathione S-transferase